MSGPFTPDEWAYNPDRAGASRTTRRREGSARTAGWLDTNNDGVLDKGGKPFKFDLLHHRRQRHGAQFGADLPGGAEEGGHPGRHRAARSGATVQAHPRRQLPGRLPGLELDPDPDVFAVFHSSQTPPKGQNFVYYNNPVADQLILQGRTELDLAKRKAALQQLHAVLAADQPYTWTIQVSAKWVISRRLHGVKESRGYGLFLWYPGELDWWIPREERIHDRPAGK